MTSYASLKRRKNARKKRPKAHNSSLPRVVARTKDAPKNHSLRSSSQKGGGEKRGTGRKGGRPIGRNTSRRKENWLRAYGSVERVEWIQGQPSIVSLRRPCVNSHVRNGGRGRKADACWIVPLTLDEEREFHRHGKLAFELKYGVNLDQWAHMIERRWLEHLKREAA